jgi:hypothetical protein
LTWSVIDTSSVVTGTRLDEQILQNDNESTQILMGYLTGSQRRVGDNLYSRPGQTISGALTYAVDVINRNHPLVHNRKLSFVVAETYGDESESIKQTAKLWSEDKVSVYIGPQETCDHEARMSDSFNLPMISYVSDMSFYSINLFDSIRDSGFFLRFFSSRKY